MSKNLKHIKGTGFKTPKDYFNNLEDTIFDKLKSESTLNKVSDPGYSMPKDYLNTIEDKVFSLLDSEETKVVHLFSKRNLLYLSGVAAAALILFTVFTNNQNVDDTELDYDMVENYIMDQNLSSYELAALLTDEEISTMNIDIMDEAFSDESVEDYLLENVNLEDILEQ